MKILIKVFTSVLIGLVTCNKSDYIDFGKVALVVNTLRDIITALPFGFELVEEKCNQVKGQNIKNELKGKLKNAVNCVYKNVSIYNIQHKFDVAPSVNGKCKVTCQIWPNFYTCLEPVLSGVKQCLSIDSRKVLKAILKLIDKSNKFFCNNNQKRFMRFIRKEGFQCLEKSSVKINNCVDPLIFTVGKSICSNFQKLRTCYINAMKECTPLDPSQIVDSFLKLVEKPVCDNPLIILSFTTYLRNLVHYSKLALH